MTSLRCNKCGDTRHPGQFDGRTCDLCNGSGRGAQFVPDDEPEDDPQDRAPRRPRRSTAA
jgi:hypothetical protein